MSRRQRILNFWLRTVEKPRMRRGTPASLRRALEMEALLFFHGPRGCKRHWEDAGGVPCLRLDPRGATQGRVLFYIHGGGFVFGSPDTHRAMVAVLAARLSAQAVMPRYRRAPEAPFPAAPDDVRAAWDGLIASGVAPDQIVVGGDSAGGALAFGLIASLCADGAALPGAVFGFSPLTDLTGRGASLHTNADVEVMLPADRVADMAGMFLQGQSAEDPRVSPIFGQFKGAPPAWIAVGDTEILLDDARGLADALRRDGVDVTLIEEHDLPHVWPIFHNVLPEARATLETLAGWIRRHQGWEA